MYLSERSRIIKSLSKTEPIINVVDFNDLPFDFAEPVVKESSEFRGGIGGKFIRMTDR